MAVHLKSSMPVRSSPKRLPKAHGVVPISVWMSIWLPSCMISLSGFGKLAKLTWRPHRYSSKPSLFSNFQYPSKFTGVWGTDCGWSWSATEREALSTLNFLTSLCPECWDHRRVKPCPAFCFITNYRRAFLDLELCCFTK